MTRVKGQKRVRSTVEINGGVYPRTKRRLREWRNRVLLPELELSIRRRAQQQADEKAAARLAEERRRSAAHSAPRESRWVTFGSPAGSLPLARTASTGRVGLLW